MLANIWLLPSVFTGGNQDSSIYPVNKNVNQATYITAQFLNW